MQGMAQEQIHNMYGDMVANFKKQCEDSLKGQNAAWNELLKSGQKNFVDMQQHYVKGHQDLFDQMRKDSGRICDIIRLLGVVEWLNSMLIFLLLETKANTEMIDKLTKNYADLKEQLQSSYKLLMSQSKTNFDKNIKSFKDNCEDAIKKVVALSPKSYQDAIKELQSLQGKNADVLTENYKSMMVKLDKSFEDTVKQLRLPGTDNKAGPGSPGPAPKKSK